MFGYKTDEAILALARFSVDREICGYIDNMGNPVAVRNIADNPSSEWLIPVGAIPENALAVWHSHPSGPACPSGEDMRYQYSSALPHGIATLDGVFWFGDTVPPLPLVGRPFRHGVTDCYQIIHDAYSDIFGIELPHYPRDWKWWLSGETLYSDNFRSAGFCEIEPSEVLPGDLLFFCMKSKTPNHAAVWLGEDLILHHLSSRLPYDPTRLSCVEDYSIYGRFISKTVRYEKGNLDRTACKEVREVLRIGHNFTG